MEVIIMEGKLGKTTITDFALQFGDAAWAKELNTMQKTASTPITKDTKLSTTGIFDLALGDKEWLAELVKLDREIVKEIEFSIPDKVFKFDDTDDDEGGVYATIRHVEELFDRCSKLENTKNWKNALAEAIGKGEMKSFEFQFIISKEIAEEARLEWKKLDDIDN